MDKELVERLLTEIRKARRSGIKTEELLSLGDYDAIQDALIWMHDKGLIIGVPLDELGDNVGDIWLSTITTAGRDYLDAGGHFPRLAVEVTFNEQQLEAIMLGLAEKFGKPGEAPALRSFFQKAGNAGINAVAAEAVKQMMAYLPEIARLFP